MTLSSCKTLVGFLVLSLLGVLVLVPIGSAASAPQQGLLAPPEIPGEVVYVPFPVSIKLDGKLDDWKDIPVQVVTPDTNTGSTPSDGSFSFSVAADAENFYITMSSFDKKIITGQHGANFWNEDSLEFYLNTSGNLNASSYGDGIFQVNINPGDIGNTDQTKLTLTGVNAGQSGVQGFVFKTANGWGFEVAAPLKVKPAHGLAIGFQVQANGASQKDRDFQLSWSNADKTNSSYQHPYVFGQALFFEVGSTDIPTLAPRAALSTATPTPLPFTTRQQISVNQTGYYPLAPKVAVVVSSSDAPIAWTLKDSSGQTVLTGQTEVKGLDTASGDKVHWIDFSAFVTAGKGYTLETEGQKSDPFEIGEEIYSSLKTDALRYFYLSRSGIALDQKYAGAWARPAGSVSDNKVTCYAGLDSIGTQWPACNYTLDASKGWYDAGDYGKYVVNGGIAVWTLLDAYEHNPGAFADGALNIPESGNGVPDILDEARWEMEFMLGMQVPEGQPLAGMVHHKLHGVKWDAMPALPAAESDSRFLFPPSTAATLNLAATAAQCVRVWKSIDADFSARCQKAAETAWKAANANPSMLAAEFPTLGGGAYGDTDVKDEFYWAAVELYLATGNQEYKNSYSTSSDYLATTRMSWGETAPLGTISLAVVGHDAAAQAAVVKYADDELPILQDSRNGYLSLLSAREYIWGSNSDVLNRAIMLALAYDYTGKASYLDGVTESMNYLLGRNTLNFSFISGYGTESLSHPHHRFWANQLGNGYPPPPPGVVAGGPNGNPDDPAAQAAGLVGKSPAKSYMDDMGSFTTNEVAINWNAPLVWVAAYLNDTGRPILSSPQATLTSVPTSTLPSPVSPASAQARPGSWTIPVIVAVVLVLAVAAVIFWRRRKR